MTFDRFLDTSLRFAGLLALGCLATMAARGAVLAWTGDPTPLDHAHLVLLRSAAFRLPDGGPAPTVKDGHAVFDGTVAVMTGSVLSVAFDVRVAGEYDIWIRAGQPGAASGPVRSQVWQGGDTPVLQSVFNAGRGGEGQGGPDGYAAYAATARATAPDGRRSQGVAGLGQPALDTAAADLGDDLLAELGGPAAQAGRWVNVTRLETVNPARPLYWWRLGRAALAPGAARLTLQADGETPAPDRALRLDTVLMTTYPHLQYPFAGDINAPRASYVRFRLDGPFDEEQGLSISGHVMHHRYPSYSSRGVFDPRGLDPVEGAVAHRQAGYTRWYRLNDIKDVPGIGGHHISLSLSLSGSAGRAGATQFAVYPHGDFVLREIPWDEPDGMTISMMLDFDRQPERLRTFRDHARENYQLALRATGERVFPLARMPLTFGNGWGAARGAAQEYMVKTLRILGLNAVSTADAPAHRRRYGWYGAGGHYWPPVWLPFDPERTADRYDGHYRDFFAGKQDEYAGVVVFQIADEPGEIQRESLSAPLWRYREPASGEGGAWHDLAGNGELRTRRTDYTDSVLEGRVSLQGNVIGFRAAVPEFAPLRRQVVWQVGRISNNAPEINLVAARDQERGAWMTRVGAEIGRAPTAFKIVHHGNRAALYIGDRLMHQHDRAAAAGGFAVFGDAKVVHDLRVRPLRPNESLQPEQPSDALDAQARAVDALDQILDLDALLEDIAAPAEAGRADQIAAPANLREQVERDWIIAGGVPEAHAGFRRWLRDQGLQPDLFGAATWDDVRLLTLASAVETAADRRLFYWSRRYSGMLTPLMFRQAAEAIHRHAPNPEMRGFVALSGHALYFPSAMPLDMFALAEGGAYLMPGVSDWMTSGSWRWDSHQAVAFSVAPYNAGGRIVGSGERRSVPMMHCVYPSVFRGYTMLANQVKHISYWTYGPSYAVTEGYWSDGFWHHQAVHTINNRAAQVDDLLADGVMRPSRVAMLYARSTEYWQAQSSFADKRAAFLVMSHDGYQPDLVTEEQVIEGILAGYDALVVLEPWVREDAAAAIGAWVEAGGLLWAAADALTRDAYNEPADVLSARFGLERRFRAGADPAPAGAAARMAPEPGSPPFRAHPVHAASRIASVSWPAAAVVGRYGDAEPAWLQAAAGKGQVIYLGHRPGLTATARAVRLGGHEVIWADTGRDPLVRPLIDAGVDREIIVSEPVIVASPLTSAAGTVIVLYNMRPAAFEALTVSLKEPKAPYAVQRFDGFDLVDQPYEFRDGRVHMTLPLGTGQGQMIAVRHAPPPPDDRLEILKAFAERLLASTDWADRTAAVWFMGFFPDWDAAPRLRPLLDDERWEIRRVAAESLGRLKDAAAGDALVAALAHERDIHARVEMLEALHRIEDPRLLDAVLALADDDHPLVRRTVFRGLTAALRRRPEPLPEPLAGTVRELLRAAMAGRDAGVRAAALDAVALLPATVGESLAADLPQRVDLAVRVALRADGEAGAPERLLALYRQSPERTEEAVAAAMAAAPVLRAALLAEAQPPPIALLLAMAQAHAAADLADALAHRLDEVTDSGRLRAAALRQRHPELSRALFRRRGQSPYDMGAFMALILEQTFDARLGNALPDWAAWLERDAPP